MRSPERRLDAVAAAGKPGPRNLVGVTATALPGVLAGVGPRTRTTQTHCPYCSLQCGVTMTAGDRPATLQPADFPTNRGGLCS